MDSLEYRTLNDCYATTVTGLSQSPNDIAIQIRPSGVLAQGDIAFLSNPQNDNHTKAVKIMDIVMIPVQSNPQVYAMFKSALQRAGPWTANIISTLEETHANLVTTSSTSLRSNENSSQIGKTKKEEDRLPAMQLDAPLQGLRLPCVLKWRRGKDMPIKMGSAVQSVVINNYVYVGGGYTNNDLDECTVMKLDLLKDQSTKLPQYSAMHFAIVSHSNQLILVGGRDLVSRKGTNQIAAFESEKWIQLHPPMKIARISAVAVSFKTLLIVAGGWDEHGRTASVEVLDMASVERGWFYTESLPNPQSELKSAIIRNTLYLFGGYRYTGPSKTVQKFDLDNAIKAIPKQISPQFWEDIGGSPLELSAPVSVGSSLLTFGGRLDEQPQSSVYACQPESKRWVKVGDLPGARYSCTCSLLPSGEIFIAGGQIPGEYLSAVDLISIHKTSLQ